MTARLDEDLRQMMREKEMTEEERKALEWLDGYIDLGHLRARTLKAMLSRLMALQSSTDRPWLEKQLKRGAGAPPLPPAAEEPVALGIAQRLREACDGHPHAKIPLPHRVLHEGANEIERLLGIALAWERLSKPAEPKTVEVWHVEYAHRPNGAWQPHLELRGGQGMAYARANRLKEQPDDYRCVFVTGPHLQTIPS